MTLPELSLIALPTVTLSRLDCPVPPLATGKVPVTPAETLAVPLKDAAEVLFKFVMKLREVLS